MHFWILFGGGEGERKGREESMRKEERGHEIGNLEE